MKKINLILLVFSIMLIFTSCGGESSNYTGSNESAFDYGDTSDTSNVSPEESIAEEKSKGANAQDKLIRPENRKLILHYNLNFETEKYEESLDFINNLIIKYKGYQTYMEESTGENRYISLTCMIPTDTVEEFINELSSEKSLNTMQKNLSSEDITDRYSDTELRLKILKEKLQRLQTMAKEKSTLEELLQLEQEISQTIYDIENIQGQLNQMDTKVNYTEVSLQINEIRADKGYTPTKVSFGERILQAIKDSGENFISGIQDLIIFIILIIPQLLILALIIFILWLISKPLRKFIKKRRDEKLKNREKKNTEDSTKEKSDKDFSKYKDEEK